MKVFVLSSTKSPLMPCHPARARELLRKKKAAVYRQQPFTIILKDRKDGVTQPVELKVDPGSKTTGLALVGDFKKGKRIIWGANLEHCGCAIRKLLERRRNVRCSRRFRKTRYRKPRFSNRTRPKGWLPPSLQSRVDNVENWAKKLSRYSPFLSIAVETVRFDMQKMVNPEISGAEYQQGELTGYEVKEYLLEKWGRKCAYCDVTSVPLEVEHIVPKSRGGSNRVSNLTLACRPCNEAKDSILVEDFVTDLSRLDRILSQAKSPLRDAAAVNATRFAIGNALKSLDMPVTFWSGGRTKFNRCKQCYPKDHWVDAMCVGDSGSKVFIGGKFPNLNIKAIGRGSRQMCRVNKFGFPRTTAKGSKRIYGFQTGDRVKAVVPKGKRKGTHVGKVSIRSRGSFSVKTEKIMVDSIHHKYFKLLQRLDGYDYRTSANDFRAVNGD